MTDIDKIKLIEHYYTGTLSLSQQKHFDQLLRADAQFKKDVKAYKKIFGGFRALQAERFQQTLQRFEQDHKAAMPTKAPAQAPRGVVRSLTNWWYAAAAAVVLLVASTVAYQNFSSDLFEQNFVAADAIALHISSTRAGEEGLTEVEQIKKNAFKAYKNGQYRQATVLLKGYRNDFPELYELDYQSIVVLGVSQLAEGNPQKALMTFDVVINSRDSLYRQEAEWMSALAHLKLKDTKKVKMILQPIINDPEHIHHQPALDLMKEL